ncbi:MAG: TIGR01906 family membrane protein [Erysipelotrichaceae bacterium]|nr:TIGR01906 family membrane protein [Erysipelotrichaceae bacterium]
MNKTLSIVISIAFILAVLLTSIDLCCFNRAFYQSEYQKLGVASNIGITDTDLLDVTDVLLDYTQGKRSDMLVSKSVNGTERAIFNTKETAHMADVQSLYLAAMFGRNICLVVLAAALVALYRRKRESVISVIAFYYNRVSVVFLLFISFIVIAALVDFNSFWTAFHHIFFAGNDLWLLNPQTDILIMMVPEQFFFDLVSRIIILFTSVFGLSNLLAFLIQKKARKEAGQ